MSTAFTEGIRVTVESRYLPEQSHPAARRYAFAYRVKIENLGGQAAQLQSRHWLITDGHGEQQEVRGEGVIGEKPLLRPGEEFSYSSGCLLTTPHGSMEGSYQLRRDDGSRFEARIAPFSLAAPNALN